MRKEAEMHAAWAALRFERTSLQTTQGLPIRILSVGTHNHDQGPDFLNAEVELDGVQMRGHIELHLRSQDWYAHGHQHDANYNPVILHVVMETDGRPVLRADQTPIPELCLQHRIAGPGIIASRTAVPCSPIARKHLPNDTITWLEDLGRARLRAKSQHFENMLKKTHFDWSQLLWQEIAKTMGGPINGESFAELAATIQWRLVRKYTFSEEALEAIIFGGAGMLKGRHMDAYHQALSVQWEYLKAKHKIPQKYLPFKLHRMRPSGMPVARLAQLVKLAQIFAPISQLLEPEIINRFSNMKIEGNPYWKGKLEFGGNGGKGKFELGQDLRNRIIANVLVPLSTVYQSLHAEASPKNEPYAVLLQLPPECNRVTRKFSSIGLKARNILQSQGLLALEKGFCKKSQCLQCLIGKRILSQNANVDQVQG